jgi:hypothetical protein
MSGKDCRLVKGADRIAMILGLIICCLVLSLVLSEYSEAKHSNVESSDAGRKLSLAIQPEQFVPALFLLSDWYQDTGSGGFPPNYSDEHPRMDEWERSPDEVPSGIWPRENCVHWPC